MGTLIIFLEEFKKTNIQPELWKVQEQKIGPVIVIIKSYYVRPNSR